MPYVPSARERRAAARLLKRRTPPARIYRTYRDQVAFWLAQPLLPAIACAGQVGEIRGARLYMSELFQREYLIAYMDTDRLARIAPKCDAIASRSKENEDDATFSGPPLVIIPDARARARSESFRSIVEHEVVHVNQMLTGNYVEASEDATAETFFESFFEHTRVEYEANLLQLTRWSRLYPQELGVSLDHWCAIRGYSQSLEHTLLRLAEEDVSPREVTRFLGGLPLRLRTGFAHAGMDAALAPWFSARWLDHLAVATVQVTSDHPSMPRGAAFRALSRWYLRARSKRP